MRCCCQHGSGRSGYEVRNANDMKCILITGGAGFIGSHVVRRMVRHYPDLQILNLDLLTYAGNLENLRDVENSPNYQFIRGDITDAAFLEQLFGAQKIDGVIHLAAESHVDRSIADPMSFIDTNIVGTVNLLNVCRQHWKDDRRNFSTTFPPMRYMGAWAVRACLPRRLPTIRGVPILLPRPVPTTWSGLTTTPMDCRWCCPIVPTIMVPTSSRKS
jgi:NAD(P)-dependent dehydrogenase (short-subunit alcohol dehydrogenase family)